MKNLDHIAVLMEQAMFETLEEMGEKASELSFFCTVEEERAIEKRAA